MMRDRPKHIRIGRSAALTAILIYFTGCAGSQLTPEEQSRYDRLTTERDQIAAERHQLTRQVQVDFNRSGQLEETTKTLAKKGAISCGYRLAGQAFGPLPFKKKRGKQLMFGKAKRAQRSDCQKHSLRIK